MICIGLERASWVGTGDGRVWFCVCGFLLYPEMRREWNVLKLANGTGRVRLPVRFGCMLMCVKFNESFHE